MRSLVRAMGIVGLAAAAVIPASQVHASIDLRDSATPTTLRNESTKERNIDCLLSKLSSLAIPLFDVAAVVAGGVRSFVISTPSTDEPCDNDDDDDSDDENNDDNNPYDSIPESLIETISATWTAYHLAFLHPFAARPFAPAVHEIGNQRTTHNITFYPPPPGATHAQGWTHVGHAYVGLQATKLDLHYRLVSVSDTGIAYHQLRTGWNAPASLTAGEARCSERTVVDYLWQADGERNYDDARSAGRSPQQFDANAGLQARTLLRERRRPVMCVSRGERRQAWDVVGGGVLALGLDGRPWEFDGNVGSWITGCYIDASRMNGGAMDTNSMRRGHWEKVFAIP